MAVRAKHRRKITCGGKTYVWYVISGEGERDYWMRVSLIEEGGVWGTPFLHIISEDKTLILTIPLNAPKPYAVRKGRVFQGKPTSGRWERYLLPFELPEAITPKTVSALIEWAERGGEAIETEYGGDIRF